MRYSFGAVAANTGAQKHHPDTAGASETSRAAYDAASEAYELLRDDETRRALAAVAQPRRNRGPSHESRYHKPPNPFSSSASAFDTSYAAGPGNATSDHYERLVRAAKMRAAARQGRPMPEFAGSSYSTSPPRYGYGLHPDDPRMHHRYYQRCAFCVHLLRAQLNEAASGQGDQATARMAHRSAMRVGVILPSLVMLLLMSLSSRRPQAERERKRRRDQATRQGRRGQRGEERSIGG